MSCPQCGADTLIQGACAVCGYGVSDAPRRRSRAPKKYGDDERERDSRYDTRRHAHGFDMADAFAQRLVAAGYRVRPLPRFHPYNVEVPDHGLYVDGRGRDIFTERGYLQHATLIVGAAKMRFAAGTNARCMIAWHSQDMRWVVFVRDLSAIRDRCKFEPKRADPVRAWQREDTWHVPVSLVERGWEELHAAIEDRVYRPALL